MKKILILIIMLVCLSSLVYSSEGTYVSKWAVTGVDNDISTGISINGSHVELCDTGNDHKVFNYLLDGTYQAVFVPDQTTAWSLGGIANNGTHKFILDATDLNIYLMDNTYVTQWDIQVSNGEPRGVTVFEEHIFITDPEDNEIYKYLHDGTPVSNFDTGANDDPNGLTTDGTYLWTLDRNSDIVYKYLMDGTLVHTWATEGTNTDPRGIEVDGDFIYIVDYGAKEVFKYEGNVTANTIEPSFSNNQTNQTEFNPIINTDVQLNLTITDDIDLDNVTFAHNMSGSFVNITTIKLEGIITTFTYIWNLTVTTLENNFGWKVQAVDSSSNINVSQIYMINIKYPILALKLFDINDNLLSFDKINTSTDFIIRANHSHDGAEIINANCNFTAYNISTHYSLDSETNLTLLDSTEQHSLIVDEDFLGMTNDFIEFRVCRENVAVDVELLVNGSLHKTIDSSIIPLCSNGFHTLINTTLEYNTKRNLNISVACSGCGGQRTIKLIKNDENEIIHFDRGFNNHSEDMIYNTTLELYEFNEHLYVYKKSGTNIGNISLSCDTTLNNTFTFEVEGFAPILSVISIDDVSFTEGMQIESSNSTNIIINAIGDITFLQFNVSYPNGSLIKSVDTESILLLSNELTEDGIYNITIFAIDTKGVNNNLSTFFLINDTINPLITTSIPNEDNSTSEYNTGTFTINSIFTDVNLFRYWINITQNNSDVLLFNESVQISGKSFSLSETLNTENYSNTTHIVTIKLCDAHTDYLIKEADRVINTASKLSYDFGNTNIYLTSINGDEKTTNSVKLTDRYTAEFTYNSKTINKVIKLEANKNIIYLPDSSYKGHFIINNYYWVDFEQPDKITSIEKISDREYIIYIDNDDNYLKLNSIGILNCEIEAYEFLLIALPPTAPALTLAETVAHTNVILLYTLFIFIELFLLFLGFKYEQQMMVFLASFMGISISISFIKFVELNRLFQNSVVIFIFINIIIIFSIGIGKIKD